MEIYDIKYIWLVVKPTPLKNESIGMIVPNIWENNSHVPVTTNQKNLSHPQFSFLSVVPS